MKIYDKTYKIKTNAFGGMLPASPVEELMKDDIGVVMNRSVSTNPFTAAVAVGLRINPLGDSGNNLTSRTFHKVLVVKKDDKYHVVKNALTSVSVTKKALPPENGQAVPVTECEYSLSITCNDEDCEDFPVENIRDAFLRALEIYEERE